MKFAVERLGADRATVGGVVEETDRQRDQYVKTYYGRHRHDVTNYDLVVNAERLGFEGAAGLGGAEAKRRGWERGGDGGGGGGEVMVGGGRRGAFHNKSPFPIPNFALRVFSAPAPPPPPPP